MKPLAVLAALAAALGPLAPAQAAPVEQGGETERPEPTKEAREAGTEAAGSEADAIEPPPPTGVIKGCLTPPDRVREAWLVERLADRRIPVAVDPKTGAFRVEGLRLGLYDLCIRTPWGLVQGLDMTPRISPYDALIPPEYRTPDLGLQVGGEPTEEDLAYIRRRIHEVRRHENRVRDLMLRGTADRVVVLVELMLDRGFAGRKGDEIVWRMEQWYYEKKYDSWARFRTRVLARQRVSKQVWEQWGWQFEPALGGLEIADETTEPVVVEYAVPERPEPAKGLAGTKMPPVK